MEQKKIFLQSEGDQWYRRNAAGLYEKQDDIVVSALKDARVEAGDILEVGCANGYRLAMLKELLGANCFGIEPSASAVAEGKKSFPGIDLVQGTADFLPYDKDRFDLVILGFCLYLCDRKDLFKIISEVDRVLREKGTLAILDFAPTAPYKNPYKHFEGVYAYKMDYPGLFTANPAYVTVFHKMLSHGTPEKAPDDPDDRISVTLLRKNSATAYPEKGKN